MTRLTSSNALFLMAWALGLLSVLTFAPFELPWLWLGIIPALLAILERTTHRLTALFWFQQGMWLSGASWIYYSIHTFGQIPLPLTLVGVTLFCTFMALLSILPFLLWRHRNGPLFRRIALAEFTAIWALGEWSREWVLTGFPWLQIAHGWIDYSISGWATIGGTLLVGFILTAIACGVYRLWMLPTLNRGLLSIGAWLTLWLVGWQLAQVPWTKPHEQTIDIAIIQPNVAQEIKWQTDELNDITTQLIRMTSDTSAELVFWPEAAIPSLLRRDSAFLTSLDRYAASEHKTIVTGVPTITYDGPNFNIHNSIIATNSEQLYHKQQLVPFGEYIPVIDLVGPIFQLLDLPVGSQARGSSNQSPINLGNKVLIAPAICYEVAYGSVVANTATSATLLSNHSNDSWFGETRGPDQHFQIARWRAVESAKPLIRATNNGISAVVDERGNITDLAPRDTVFTLETSVTPRDGKTPFQLWLNYPLIIVVATILLLGRFRARNNK